MMFTGGNKQKQLKVAELLELNDRKFTLLCYHE